MKFRVCQHSQAHDDVSLKLHVWQPRVISSILVRYPAATLKRSAIGGGTIGCHPDKFQDLGHPIIFEKYQVKKTFIAGITNFVYAIQCLIFPMKQVQFVLQKNIQKEEYSEA